MHELHWYKSVDNRWINLMEIDLTYVHATGVYIIWHGGSSPRIVRVGQGNIASRLDDHRKNIQITRYLENGKLMVTWAEIADQFLRGGIERYLSEQFQPLVRGQLTERDPIQARSPFL